MKKIERRVADVIRALETRLKELSSLPDYAHVRLVPGPPATDEALAAYERHLGRALPPSYRAFLELHDGYRGLAYPGDMLAIGDLLPGGKWAARAAVWRERSSRAGAEETREAIPIANLGQPNSWVFLDPTQPAALGELMVVEWDPEDTTGYQDLVAFLEECLETVEYGIAEANGLVSDDD
ncbi:MAG: SMI1/KNR4 family protein [Myxococcaceae bacterium]|nr:SMI1/KNR4 family protein [Myxococcaceae bacterium]